MITTLALPLPVSRKVAPSVGRTVKVRVNTTVSAIVAGAVQVTSSTVVLLNIPPSGLTVHARSMPLPSALRDVASSSTTVAPSTVWSAVWMLTVGR